MSYIGSKPANKPVVASDLDPTVITGQTALAVAPADTDEFLISDAGTLKRLDASLIGGATHVLLSTTNVTSGVSEVDITSNIDSTYKNYMISYTNIHPSVDAQTFRMRIFSSAGSPYTANEYKFASIGRKVSGSDATCNNTGQSYWSLGAENNIGSENIESISGSLILHNPSETTFGKLAQADSVCLNNDQVLVRSIDGLFINNTAAITGVRFYFGSGNIDNGIIKLYGII